MDIWIRFKILPGLKISGHTDTLIEAGNLTDELKKVKYRPNNNIEMILFLLIFLLVK